MFPERPNQFLTSYNQYTWSSGHSDPEGTFGRNQQLTSSMGLSPLYTSETSDLHVSTVAAFQTCFRVIQRP